MYSRFHTPLTIRSYSNPLYSQLFIKMQLRSGNTTRTVNTVSEMDRVIDNARFCGKIHQRENITMTVEAPTSSGKTTTKPTIAKHPMRLRSSSRRMAGSQPYPKPMHSAYMVSAQTHKAQANHISQEGVFYNWLVARLRTLIVDDFKKTSGVFTTPRLMERVQLMVEMVAVLEDHIDYITTHPNFARFSQLIVSKMSELAKQITAILNGESVNGVVFNLTPEESAILGNARADMVKLTVITNNRLPQV